MRPASFVLVGVLLCGSCFLGLARGLWTPDEPREAGISREMYANPGVIPTLNGQPFVEKPPLYYWATAFSFRLAGGPTAAAARAVSALSAVLTLAVLFLWAWRAVSIDTAVVSTLILATCAGFITSANWVRIDELLLLCCTIAIWSAWERVGRGGGPQFLALFYSGLVLALWTKGLIGPVLIGTGLVSYAAISRSIRVLAPLRPVAGAGVLVLAVGLLAAAIGTTGGMDALKTWLFVNHVERFVHPVATGHQAPLGYYAWTLPAAVAPWVIPFVAVFHFRGPLWKRDRADAAVIRFAAAMTAGPLVVLSLSSSKREVYLLPLLPALALLMGTATRDRVDAEGLTPRPGRWTRAGDWLQAAILGLSGLAPAVAHAVFTRSVTAVSAVIGLAGIVAGGALALAVYRGRAAHAFWIGAASMGLALTGVFALVVPQVDAVKNFEPFLLAVDGMLPRGEPVPSLGADETLLGIVPFVTGRRVIPIVVEDLTGLAFVLVQSVRNQPGPGSLEPAFEQIAMREFGPSRRLALWRRRDTPR